MIFLKKLICFTFPIIVLFTSTGLAQDSASPDSSKDEIMSAAREIMTSAHTCALVTIDQENHPRTRAMDPFLPESDFTVWFGTNPRSGKVAQIQNNPNVSLYYLDSLESGYVAIYGIAQIVNDKVEKEKRWKDAWEAFYQNKTDDYILIKVVPVRMEVVSYTYGLVGDTVTWEAPAVIFNQRSSKD